MASRADIAWVAGLHGHFDLDLLTTILSSERDAQECVGAALRSGLIEVSGDGFRSTNPNPAELVAFAMIVFQKLDGPQHSSALQSLQALEPQLENALPSLEPEARVHALVVLGELAVRLGGRESLVELLEECVLEQLGGARLKLVLGRLMRARDCECIDLLIDAATQAERDQDWGVAALAWANAGYAEHRSRMFTHAIASQLEALNCLSKRPNARLEGIVLGCLLALHIDRGEYERAAEVYERVFGQLHGASDDRHVLYALAHRADLLRTLGQLPRAQVVADEAINGLRSADVGYLSVATEIRARIQVDAREWDDAAASYIAASRLYDEALRRNEADDARDAANAALSLVGRGAADSPTPSSSSRIRGEIYRSIAIARCQPTLARAMRHRVRGLTETEAERHALKWLEFVLDDGRPARVELEIDADARWFRVEGAIVRLDKRPSLQRIVVALLDARWTQPASMEVLVTAGWPDESLIQSSGSTRVHTALHTLRKMGLGKHLERTQVGYRIQHEGVWERFGVDL